MDLLAPPANGKAVGFRWCGDPIARAPMLEQTPRRMMDPNAIPTSALWYLSGTVGFRVDGPDGCHGVVHGIPRVGRPLRPLVLIVSDGTTVRFISLREIATVSRGERRIVLHPQEATVSASARKAA